MEEKQWTIYVPVSDEIVPLSHSSFKDGIEKGYIIPKMFKVYRKFFKDGIWVDGKLKRNEMYNHGKDLLNE